MADSGKGKTTPEAVAEAPGEKSHEVLENTSARQQSMTDDASIKEALKAMAAGEGIYFGEVPEGFPLELLPLYPGGTIEQSAIDGEGATLLQEVPASKEKVLKHYSDYYKKLGLSPDTEVNVAGRLIVGFSGSAADISMTISDREEGKTFVSLAF